MSTRVPGSRTVRKIRRRQTGETLHGEILAVLEEKKEAFQDRAALVRFFSLWTVEYLRCLTVFHGTMFFCRTKSDFVQKLATLYTRHLAK